MGAFLTICRAVTLLACIGAGITLLATLGGSNSAIQQAAGAAMAAAFVIIPYIFTRIIEGMHFRDPEARICPSCAERVKPGAVVCPHCRADVVPIGEAVSVPGQ